MADHKDAMPAQQGKPGSSPPPPEKAKSASTLRRLWEKVKGESWQKNPATGRNQDVAQIKAKADGGLPNDPNNFKPQPHNEHMQEHKDNGDFKRWGARSGGAPSPGDPPAGPGVVEPPTVVEPNVEIKIEIPIKIGIQFFP
jgi:hypothetical protein